MYLRARNFRTIFLKGRCARSLASNGAPFSEHSQTRRHVSYIDVKKKCICWARGYFFLRVDSLDLFCFPVAAIEGCPCNIRSVSDADKHSVNLIQPLDAFDYTTLKFEPDDLTHILRLFSYLFLT